MVILSPTLYSESTKTKARFLGLHQPMFVRPAPDPTVFLAIDCAAGVTRKINFCQWVIAEIRVQVQRLRILKIRIWYWDWRGTPVGTHPASEPVRVIPCPEVVEACFEVAFFAGEFVVVGVVVDELQFSAPGVIIRFGFDHAGRIGDHRRGLEMVREVIEDAACAGSAVTAGNALAGKGNVFRFQSAGQIAFGDDAGRHVPVERAVGGQVPV
jgi:hypothetical protein